MRIALFQPDIAGNVGTILRLAACFGLPVDIIEPCGFAFSERSLKRAGMDYAAQAQITRHIDWDQFLASRSGRLILLSTKGDSLLTDAGFADGTPCYWDRNRLARPISFMTQPRRWCVFRCGKASDP